MWSSVGRRLLGPDRGLRGPAVTASGSSARLSRRPLRGGLRPVLTDSRLTAAGRPAYGSDQARLRRECPPLGGPSGYGTCVGAARAVAASAGGDPLWSRRALPARATAARAHGPRGSRPSPLGGPR